MLQVNSYLDSIQNNKESFLIQGASASLQWHPNSWPWKPFNGFIDSNLQRIGSILLDFSSSFVWYFRQLVVFRKTSSKKKEISVNSFFNLVTNHSTCKLMLLKVRTSFSSFHSQIFYTNSLKGYPVINIHLSVVMLFKCTKRRIITSIDPTAHQN